LAKGKIGGSINTFKKQGGSHLAVNGAMGQLGLTYLVWDQMTPVQTALFRSGEKALGENEWLESPGGPTFTLGQRINTQ